jgi:Fur family peroxide stress response transcriptional regulator
MITDQFVSTLKAAGIRPTPQRLAICQYLGETRAHPTAAAVYEHVRARYPSLSLMTVYNTLNTLVEMGMVNALGGAGDNNVHYDGNTSPHINLACIQCHRIIDISLPNISDLEGDVSRASGYKVLGARMVYYGLCPDCQESNK